MALPPAQQQVAGSVRQFGKLLGLQLIRANTLQEVYSGNGPSPFRN